MEGKSFLSGLENRVERRMDVDELVITLAFPNQERLQRGKTLPGVYAFLPTEMISNFPFIIQADFVLAYQGRLLCWMISGTKGYLTVFHLLSWKHSNHLLKE